MGETRTPRVPEILKIGTRGVRAKIWTFLYLNRPNWFTSQEISRHLDMPLSTVQVALKDICSIAPRIKCKDKPKSGKGRTEKEYSFQRTLTSLSGWRWRCFFGARSNQWTCVSESFFLAASLALILSLALFYLWTIELKTIQVLISSTSALEYFHVSL